VKQVDKHYAAVRPITPFKVIQGLRVWYQSKAHMRLPIVTYLLSCTVFEI